MKEKPFQPPIDNPTVKSLVSCNMLFFNKMNLILHGKVPHNPDGLALNS
jgi:hypothetical protein